MTGVGQSETSGQTYLRWFTDYPSTHVKASQTVEVVTVEEANRRIQAAYDVGYEDGAASARSQP